ncbi:MAG: SWIM zinc finger family protein [Armatimonadota bacterium]
MSLLNRDQILALAPDPASAKAGQGLASPRKWSGLGRSDRALWGECQGSGANPYQARVDLSGPAYRCTCPSRKFPCKHALGLLLLSAASPDLFPAGEPPSWVAEWLAGRDRRAAPPEPKAAPADPEAQVRRAQERSQRVAAGLAELELWLRDVVRGGIASLQGRPYSFWDTPASRMVDCQAPAIARQLRGMAGLAASGPDWPDRLLQRLGRLYLLAEGFKHLESLPPEVQADLRTAVGWSQRSEELTSEPGVRDRWQVLGQRVEDEETLRTQRTWLRGSGTGRSALLLQFAFGDQPFDAAPIPGTEIDAELAFWPSAYPLRAAVRQSHVEPKPLAMPDGHADAEGALRAYAEALAANPWLEQFPMLFAAVAPARIRGEWALLDPDGRTIPLSPRFTRVWTLAAASGGSPVRLFGEWDGDSLLPLSAVGADGWTPL